MFYNHLDIYSMQQIKEVSCYYSSSIDNSYYRSLAIFRRKSVDYIWMGFKISILTITIENLMQSF